MPARTQMDSPGSKDHRSSAGCSEPCSPQQKSSWLPESHDFPGIFKPHTLSLPRPGKQCPNLLPPSSRAPALHPFPSGRPVWSPCEAPAFESKSWVREIISVFLETSGQGPATQNSPQKERNNSIKTKQNKKKHYCLREGRDNRVGKLVSEMISVSPSAPWK